MEAIDCQSFAGGFTLGMKNAGFDIVAKREEAGGFGIPIVADNMPIPDIQAAEPSKWEARRADVVFGNPPCSGFSLLTMVSNRTGWGSGIDHGINQCMWNLVRFGAKCDPQILIMESVQAAYKTGRPLMVELRAEMEKETGKKYDLVHVLQNNASLGGASIRKRYFMVLVRDGIPFGIDPPRQERLCTFGELLEDLEDAPLRREFQNWHVDGEFHPYVETLRNIDGFDGHETRTSAEIGAMEWLSDNVDWFPGEHIGTATYRAIERFGYENLPPFFYYREEYRRHEIKKSLLSSHAYAPRRWAVDKVGGVATGTATEDIVHPHLPRTITFRECARLMGFPDSWSLKTIWTAKGGASQNQKWLGKGISVPCGEWIGQWTRAALEGRPGWWRGDLIGEREWLIDVTNDHKTVYDERSGEHRDSRNPVLKKQMADRKPWVDIQEGVA